MKQNNLEHHNELKIINNLINLNVFLDENNFTSANVLVTRNNLDDLNERGIKLLCSIPILFFSNVAHNKQQFHSEYNLQAVQ